MHIQTFQWLQQIIETPSSFSFWQMLRWLYRLPGSLVIEALGQVTPLAQWLHIQASAATGYASLDGRIIHVLSLFFWAALLLWILHTSSEPKSRAKPLQERKAPHLRPTQAHPLMSNIGPFTALNAGVRSKNASISAGLKSRRGTDVAN